MTAEIINYSKTWTTDMIQQLHIELTLAEELESALLQLRQTAPEYEILSSSTLKDLDCFSRSVNTTKKALEWYLDTFEKNIQSEMVVYEDSLNKTLVQFD